MSRVRRCPFLRFVYGVSLATKRMYTSGLLCNGLVASCLFVVRHVIVFGPFRLGGFRCTMTSPASRNLPLSRCYRSLTCGSTAGMASASSRADPLTWYLFSVLFLSLLSLVFCSYPQTPCPRGTPHVGFAAQQLCVYKRPSGPRCRWSTFHER